MPSSPLATKSVFARRATASPARAIASPSKSFILDTGPADSASPWRIKVTVEAEPKDSSSPAKKVTRTTKVPLKGMSSTPAKPKRATPARKKSGEPSDGTAGESEGEVGKVQRKRKGTPIRRRGTRSQTGGVEDELEAGFGDSPVKRQSAGRKGALQQELDAEPDRLKPRSTATTRKPTPERPSEQSKRLSQARQDLDSALRDAVGRSNGSTFDESEEDQDDIPILDIHSGDMTVANEDFTMVSVETLESMKQNTSLLLENSGVELGGGDKSGVSVSYMPSSPPESRVGKVQYPDIARMASAAQEKSMRSSIVATENGGAAGGYDVMSWQATGPASSYDGAIGSARKGLEYDAMSWKPSDPTPNLVANEDDVQLGAGDDRELSESEDEEQTQARNGDDIWAEEASRSLEDDEQDSPDQKHQPSNPPQNINDLFSDQPLKPPRPKIFKTWRRTSGMDFSYVDSPEYGALKSWKGKETEGESGGGGSGRSSGVLTPPSTDDEKGKKASEEESELTEPDGVGTQLQAPTPARSSRLAQSLESRGANARVKETSGRSEAPIRIASSLESSSSGPSEDVESPGSENGDDTGIFFQRQLPNVYQRNNRPKIPQQKKAVDLSELLGTTREKSGDISQVSNQTQSQNVAKVILTAAPETPAQEQVVSIPLQKGLLESRDLGSSALHVVGIPQLGNISRPARARFPGSSRLRQAREQKKGDSGGTTSELSETSRTEESGMESFESKASDQRQLLGEMSGALNQKRNDISDQRSVNRSTVGSLSEERVAEESTWAAAGGEINEEGQEYDDGSEDVEDEESESREITDQRTRSYEEHLNVESPQKIRVKFNDSEGNSSLLSPKRQYAPLFGKLTARQNPVAAASAPTRTLVSKQASPPVAAQSGIFTRLSTSFWSAVVRPSGPAEIIPTPQEPDPVYPPNLRAMIRSRYGILSSTHPWTMAHMRTLHRLLNSCTSGKSDSIVPRSGPLPSFLRLRVGKELEAVTADFRWIFSEQHAHVVDAFMQTLVQPSFVEAMANGEVDFLGDEEAEKHRGTMAGRRGDMVVFDGVEGVKNLPRIGDEVGMEWVVKCVGNCLRANVETAKRERARVEEERVRLEKIRESRKIFESRNGISDDEYESSSLLESSEVMTKAPGIQNSSSKPSVAPLQRPGYEVVSCRLHASGVKEPRPSFEDELQNIISKIDREIKASNNVCLMAHSAGGWPTWQAVNQFLSTATTHNQAKLAQLIFVASFSNMDRTITRSVEDGWRKEVPETGNLYADNPAKIFYNTISKEEAQPFVDALISFKPWVDTPAALSGDDWKKVPNRSYVIWTEDKIQHLDLQEKEIEEHGWATARAEFDHCPFVTKPEEFAMVVDAVLKSGDAQ